MIPFNKALETILDNASPIDVETIPVNRAIGRYLALEINAPFPLPLFDNSAVDGYGIRCQGFTRASISQPIPIKVVGDIPAGSFLNVTLGEREAVKIFTGAPIPDDVEAVVMREEVENSDPPAIKRPISPGENIRRKGEEFKEGDRILPVSSPINPASVGLISSLGIKSVSVFKKPRIALIVTGNEIVRGRKKLRIGEIYDANAPALISALKFLNLQPQVVEYILDDIQQTIAALKKALTIADVVIVSGGVSAGDWDLVGVALERVGVHKLFHKVAMKPGKPNWFGITDEKPPKLVFGLPGNPVSALISYHQLVKPALLKIMGSSQPRPLLFTAFIQSEVTKKDRRREFLRAKLSYQNGYWSVTPFKHQSSHMLGGMTLADSLIHFPEHLEHLSPGDKVQVQFLRWDSP
ncbi:MAG: gephyrin-like molybdotransferase Glp [bacterium]